MKLLIILGSVVGPIIMVYLQKLWPRIEPLYHVLAYISVLVFGNIAALAIYGIIRDKTVFMTEIHGIFLNPWFLLTGSYLGVYLVYKIIGWAMEETRA